MGILFEVLRIGMLVALRALPFPVEEVKPMLDVWDITIISLFTHFCYIKIKMVKHIKIISFYIYY